MLFSILNVNDVVAIVESYLFARIWVGPIIAGRKGVYGLEKYKVLPTIEDPGQIDPLFGSILDVQDVKASQDQLEKAIHSSAFCSIDTSSREHTISTIYQDCQHDVIWKFDSARPFLGVYVQDDQTQQTLSVAKTLGEFFARLYLENRVWEEDEKDRKRRDEEVYRHLTLMETSRSWLPQVTLFGGRFGGRSGIQSRMAVSAHRKDVPIVIAQYTTQLKRQREQMILENKIKLISRKRKRDDAFDELSFLSLSYQSDELEDILVQSTMEERKATTTFKSQVTAMVDLLSKRSTERVESWLQRILSNAVGGEDWDLCVWIMRTVEPCKWGQGVGSRMDFTTVAHVFLKHRDFETAGVILSVLTKNVGVEADGEFEQTVLSVYANDKDLDILIWVDDNHWGGDWHAEGEYKVYDLVCELIDTNQPKTLEWVMERHVPCPKEAEYHDWRNAVLISLEACSNPDIGRIMSEFVEGCKCGGSYHVWKEDKEEEEGEERSS